MGRTKIVTMRFDMDNEYDVATYERLAETSQRADRRGMGNQALYLTSLMLSTRPYMGLRNTGLDEMPRFHPDINERVAILEAISKELSRETAEKPAPKQNSPPVLRLMPACDKDYPQQSA